MYKLAGHAAGNLIFSNGREEVVIHKSMVLYLEADRLLTRIIGVNADYTVEATMGIIRNLLNKEDFIQITDRHIVSRHHVNTFDNGVIGIGKDFIRINKNRKITEDKFPLINLLVEDSYDNSLPIGDLRVSKFFNAQ